MRSGARFTCGGVLTRHVVRQLARPLQGVAHLRPLWFLRAEKCQCVVDPNKLNRRLAAGRR
jgi:hypothetical protein